MSYRKIGKIHAFDEAYLIVQFLKCSLYAVDFEGGFSWSKIVVYRYEELIETIVYVSKIIIGKSFKMWYNNISGVFTNYVSVPGAIRRCINTPTYGSRNAYVISENSTDIIVSHFKAFSYNDFGYIYNCFNKFFISINHNLAPAKSSLKVYCI